MDKHYYFIVEPTGDEDGPYHPGRNREEARRGAVSPEASLFKVGETRRRRSATSRVRSRRCPAAPAAPPPGDAAADSGPCRAGGERARGAPAVRAATAAAAGRARGAVVQAWAIAAGIAAVGLGAAIAASRGGKAQPVKDAMVRVTTPSGTGAGFLIEVPTTLRLRRDREPRRRSRRARARRARRRHRQATRSSRRIPETEIVATDPDADLAIIRIKNVDASRFSAPHAREGAGEGRADPVVRLSRFEPGEARGPGQSRTARCSRSCRSRRTTSATRACCATTRSMAC